MNRQIKKYKLDHSRVLPYVMEQLDCGNTLSKFILEFVDLKKYSFFTFLPLEADLTRLYEFTYGGIIPAQKCEGKEGGQKSIRTTTSEICSYVQGYIKENHNNCAVFEDVISFPTDLCLKNSEFFSFRKEVYYLIDNKSENLNKVDLVLLKSSQVWHTLFLLTKCSDKISSRIFSEEQIKNFCINSAYIILGAYDGEGYIWGEAPIS